MTKNLKDPPYPCENCLILPMCLRKDHFTIAMDCDLLVNHLVDKYKSALVHFGRACIIVKPLEKKFEMELSHEKRGVVIGQPNSEYFNPKRIVVNPYHPRNKMEVVKE